MKRVRYRIPGHDYDQPQEGWFDADAATELGRFGEETLLRSVVGDYIIRHENDDPTGGLWVGVDYRWVSYQQAEEWLAQGPRRPGGHEDP